MNLDHAPQLSDSIYKHMVYIVYNLYYHNATTVRGQVASHINASMAKTLQEAIKYLNRKRCKPSLKIRDNIYSKVDEAYMNGQDVNIKFGARRNNHLNAAEKSIATFKNVFIVEVETLDTKCSINPAPKLPRITIEDGLIVAASRLNCATQMSSALAEVVSELDEVMVDPDNMVVSHYLTRAGVVIAAGHAMTPANARAVPPIIAAFRPVQNGAAEACRPAG